MALGFVVRRSGSAVEDEPAQLVSQTLVVEHEIANLRWELIPLPAALGASSLRGVVRSCGRLHRPDPVGRRTELMGRHVADRGRLAGGVRGMSGSPAQIPGCRVGMPARRASVPPADLAARPGSPELDCAAGPIVIGPRRFEEMQHVLGAIRRPQTEEVVMVVGEAATAAHGDEPRIPDLRENHRSERPR